MSVTWEPRSTDDEKIRLNMVMLSEDPAAQRRARRFQSKLMREMDEGCTLDCKTWLLDALSDPDTLPSVTEQAVGADMLVLSIHGASGPRHGFDGWIKAWSESKTHALGAALVLLCDRSRGTWPGAVAARACMRKIAGISGVEFFEPGSAHLPPPVQKTIPANRPRLSGS